MGPEGLVPAVRRGAARCRTAAAAAADRAGRGPVPALAGIAGPAADTAAAGAEARTRQPRPATAPRHAGSPRDGAVHPADLGASSHDGTPRIQAVALDCLLRSAGLYRLPMSREQDRRIS